MSFFRKRWDWAIVFSAVAVAGAASFFAAQDFRNCGDVVSADEGARVIGGRNCQDMQRLKDGGCKFKIVAKIENWIPKLEACSTGSKYDYKKPKESEGDVHLLYHENCRTPCKIDCGGLRLVSWASCEGQLH